MCKQTKFYQNKKLETLPRELKSRPLSLNPQNGKNGRQRLARRVNFCTDTSSFTCTKIKICDGL